MEQKFARYRELEEQMADPAVAVDHARYTAVAKELGALGKLVKPYLEFQELEAAIRGAEDERFRVPNGSGIGGPPKGGCGAGCDHL